jgi:aryl-alcohol dehydrogenase-like predicted oxidoreductase
MNSKYPLSRRDFIKLSAITAAGTLMWPPGYSYATKAPSPLMRKFGNTKYMVTTLGLGGQGSIQWTPDGVDPVAIILKAFELGVNFFDTSNMYGTSQTNYNLAFRKLNLIPGETGYNKKLRESIVLTSKTLMRWGKPGWKEVENVRNGSNGEDVQCAVDDLKRSLSQIFGDGKGNYPEGAYLDFMLIHSITSFEEVDVLYKGLETHLNPDENFGALVALRDFRDGTNLTGTNPRKEKLIKHIGFSSHDNPSVMIDMIQRDEFGINEAMLVALNANDKLYFNMQNNVLPVARAKGLGIIGMKVFANGVMYGEKEGFSRTPADVYMNVGAPALPSHELIEYVLNSPNMDTLIIGIGHVDDDPLKCQLTQNYYASQIEPDALSKNRLLEIEEKAAKVKGGKTNYFQMDKNGLSAPQDVQVQTVGDKTRVIWQTAFAEDVPISHYEVLLNGEKIGKVDHRPQILKSKPFVFETAKLTDMDIAVRTVDENGDRSYVQPKGTTINLNASN